MFSQARPAPKIFREWVGFLSCVVTELSCPWRAESNRSIPRMVRIDLPCQLQQSCISPLQRACTSPCASPASTWKKSSRSTSRVKQPHVNKRTRSAQTERVLAIALMRNRTPIYSASTASSSFFSEGSGATSISTPSVSAADFIEREIRRRSRSISMTLT